MLQTIRKYRRSVLGVVGIGLVALAMGGFGVNMATQPRGNYAIKVGDKEVSFEEFAQIRRALEARYQQMFGENYLEFVKNFNINVGQQAIDNAINEALMTTVAEEIGFVGGSKAVQETIHKELFAGQFDPQRYKDFLASQGMSPQQFEAKLREDIARQQLADLWADTAKASDREAKAMLKRDKTLYSFVTLSVDPAEQKKSVAEPSKEEISKYYEDNLTEFQTPVRISYNYIALDPADFLSEVPVTEEDIELEYTDNPSSYQSPAEVRISQILLKFPDNASEEQKDVTRKTAREVVEKAKAGQKFEELVKLFTQDPIAALKGGDSGWVTKDKLPTAIAARAFSAEKNSISDPIETDKAIFIFRLDDKKEEKLKDLAEVRAEITLKLQTLNAPAILALKAQDLFESWSKTGNTLAEFAKEAGFKEQKTAIKLTKESDPEASLKNLTANILVTPDSKQQIVELGEKEVFVEVTELVEEGVESLELASPKIIDTLKSRAAREQANAKANQILESIKNGEVPDLKEAAKKNGFKSEEILEVASSSARGVVAEPSIRERVFSYSAAPQKPNEVFNVGNNFALVELTAIKNPTADDINSGLAGMRKGLDKELADFSLEAFLAKLKSETTIDIQPGLLAEQS